MESIPGEDALNFIEVTTKDLEYDRSLLDKALAGHGRIYRHYERSSAYGE
jgi:hypothetical protein